MFILFMVIFHVFLFFSFGKWMNMAHWLFDEWLADRFKHNWLTFRRSLIFQSYWRLSKYWWSSQCQYRNRCLANFIWLVVWNINFFFPIYWEFHHPNWLSYFSEGWPNHQPVINRADLPSDRAAPLIRSDLTALAESKGPDLADVSVEAGTMGFRVEKPATVEFSSSHWKSLNTWWPFWGYGNWDGMI